MYVKVSKSVSNQLIHSSNLIIVDHIYTFIAYLILLRQCLFESDVISPWERSNLFLFQKVFHNSDTPLGRPG